MAYKEGLGSEGDARNVSKYKPPTAATEVREVQRNAFVRWLEDHVHVVALGFATTAFLSIAVSSAGDKRSMAEIMAEAKMWEVSGESPPSPENVNHSVRKNCSDVLNVDQCVDRGGVVISSGRIECCD